MLPVEILYKSQKTVVGCTNRGTVTDMLNPYDGFCMCGYTGDDPEHVDACVGAMARFFGLDASRMLVPLQVHGTEVAVVESVPVNDSFLDGVDAVVTTVPDLMVGVSTADCIPVILSDENVGVVAAVHAGWRGAVAGIVEKTVGIMRKLGAGNIKGFIGPGICCSCFEVGPEVAIRFPAGFVSYAYGDRPHVDLPGYVASILEQCGVAIALRHSGCTRCMPQRYFSARALGIHSGRNYTFGILFGRK